MQTLGSKESRFVTTLTNMMLKRLRIVRRVKSAVRVAEVQTV